MSSKWYFTIVHIYFSYSSITGICRGYITGLFMPDGCFWWGLMRKFLLVVPKKKTEDEGERSDNNETLPFLLPPLRATAPFDPFLGLSSRPRWKKIKLNDGKLFYGLIELYIKQMSWSKEWYKRFFANLSFIMTNGRVATVPRVLKL